MVYIGLWLHSASWVFATFSGTDNRPCGTSSPSASHRRSGSLRRLHAEAERVLQAVASIVSDRWLPHTRNTACNEVWLRSAPSGSSTCRPAARRVDTRVRAVQARHVRLSLYMDDDCRAVPVDRMLLCLTLLPGRLGARFIARPTSRSTHCKTLRRHGLNTEECQPLSGPTRSRSSVSPY